MKLKEIELGFKEISFSHQDFLWFLTATLSKKAAFRFRAKGFSMLPFIRDGDTIILSSLPDSSIRLGEVAGVIHPQTGNFIVHRVIARKRDFYLIKGDNVWGADGLISTKSILGYVTKVERKGRRVFLGFGFERTLIALLSRGHFFCLLLYVWKILPLKVRSFFK